MGTNSPLTARSNIFFHLLDCKIFKRNISVYTASMQRREKCSSTGGKESWLENEEWNTCVDRHRKPLSVGYLSPLMSVGQPASAKKIKENCSCRSTQQGIELLKSGPILPSLGLQKVQYPWNRVLTLSLNLNLNLSRNLNWLPKSQSTP